MEQFRLQKTWTHTWSHYELKTHLTLKHDSDIKQIEYKLIMVNFAVLWSRPAE